MPRKPGTRASAEFVLFDVVYEDGSQRSNRRVPIAVLGGAESDGPAGAFIAEQDRAIAMKSGLPAISIKSVRRSGSKTHPIVTLESPKPLKSESMKADLKHVQL
jgi:hypothetical protein